MSFDNYTGDEADESAKMAFFMLLFSQKRTRRVNFEQQWDEGAALAWPEYMGSFYFGRDISPGIKRSQFQVDSHVSISSHRFGAICDWLLTPSNMMWSKIEADDDYVMKQRGVKQWFRDVTKTLWTERYKARANFIGQNQTCMQSCGVFGNMALWVDELDNIVDPRERGLRYMNRPVGEIYLLTDHQNSIVGYIRHFRLNAQQFAYRWPEKIPPIVQAALSISSQQLFDVLHFIRPRVDYLPEEIMTNRGKKYVSTYISIQGYCILEEGGYRILPQAYGRYMQAPDEDYGRGPMQMVLASAKTKNAQKRVFLKQGHRAGDPVYLVSDTGLMDLKTAPGSWNAGAMSKDGKPLVGILPTGQIQITQEMMAEEGKTIDDAFLVNLFQMVLGDKDHDMSARQVLEYINERGIILGPTVGRQLSEYCGPIIDRELDILSWLRKLPPMPPILREAKSDYKVVYSNPITRALQLQENAGYVRSMEVAGEAVKMTGDPSLMDIFEFDTSLPAMGERDNAPAEWYSTPQSLAKKRKARDDAEQRDQQVKMLPGQAAIMKAQAIAAKAQTGGNTGGTLSGTPQGGMPQMPGQEQPGGRNFGGQMPS